ncbi:MAG: hypothetical protein ACLQGT_15865 [Terracidiphilus sp.]
MPDSKLKKQFGRITFLFSCLMVAGLSGAAQRLLQAHAESRRAWMAVGYCLILLGVFWIRSLERRLADAGLPRWSFWPYFLIVFIACPAAFYFKYTNRQETLGLFLLLQLPAILFESKSAQGELSSEGVKLPVKPLRPVAPLSALEFAIFLMLIAGLWHVLHLLRGDVGGMANSRVWRYALDTGSWLLCLPWFFIVRGRLKALGRMRWTMVFCATVFFSCLLLFYFRVISFPWAIVLFVVPQIPVIILRKETISGRVIPVDSDS